MSELIYPAGFALLGEEEQLAANGGSELWDSAKEFFKNIHFEDFSWGDAFVAVSFTFAPVLLFNVFKVIFQMALDNKAAK